MEFTKGKDGEQRFLNIAGYKFVLLDPESVPALRESFRSTCRTLELRGTIILSTEGINVVLSGHEAKVREAIRTIRNEPPFSDLPFKESWSDHVAFNRMLVKVKKEIIPLGIPELNPPVATAPYIEPSQLKNWIDEGREFVLLDTRNDYEVSVGTFRNAIDLGISNFRGFPSALTLLQDEIRRQPIVTFCTGGIRCEKAAPLMMEQGFKEVYQLHGGILQYFEDHGNAHFEGECFVFDQRVAVDGNLNETDTVQCFRCQMPLSVEEQRSPLYEAGISCPHCAVSAA